MDARADLIFNYGAPYQRARIGQPPTAFAHSNLDAQRIWPIRITQIGSISTVGVRFRTGGLGVFCALPISRYTNRTCPLEEAFGQEILQLESALVGQAPKPLLDEFFLARLKRKPDWHRFDRLKQAIEDSQGVHPIESLCEQLSLSQRSADRLFRTYLGFSPKVFARISRFQKALRLLMGDSQISLAQVATQCSYYDQSHFVKDFRAFTGGVPRGFKGYFPTQGPDDFAPNVVQFLQDNPTRKG